MRAQDIGTRFFFFYPSGKASRISKEHKYVSCFPQIPIFFVHLSSALGSSDS